MSVHQEVTRMDGLAIKIDRIRLGLRQYEVAQRAGIRPGELSEFENGRRQLSPEKLARLDAALRQKEAVAT